MKIGITSIYSFRPHPEHLAFLAKILKMAGHELAFLACDASVKNCYPQLMRRHGKLRECPKCVLGGMRSYPVTNVRHIVGKDRADLPKSILDTLCASSSYTIARTETREDRDSDGVKIIRESLYESVDTVVENTRKWIIDEQLGGVICFNGRRDMTRGVTYACERLGIPFITCERSWLGHGLQLIPNHNCLSLSERTKLNMRYADKPLTRSQAGIAGQLAAQRFLKKNALEWRLYNVRSSPVIWPIKASGPRVLILPSSKNEFDGHEEWASEWDDYTVAIDKLLVKLDVPVSRCVLRCHPNWAENIGRQKGEDSERHYTAWAGKNNIYCIASADTANTYDLMLQADIIIVNGSTSGVEAALLGKRVICLGHAPYQGAGVAVHILSELDWERLSILERHDSKKVMRYALRYFYTQAARFPQYVDFVRAESTTKYHYFEGADADRVITMFKTGNIEADDAQVASSHLYEDEILEAMEARAWEQLIVWEGSKKSFRPLKIRRRMGLGWVDSVRNLLPRGDR